jgi:hypothetical protein
MVKRFEYEISQHPGEDFKQLVYFCSETGECSVSDVSGDETEILRGILNERGRQGWDLVQVTFGKDGVMAFWKRKVKDKKKA